MAGLISESTSAISSQVPGLGSLPVLGALFRSVRYRRGETELLLLVTAGLVEPSSDQVRLPLPGSTHVVPSDWELYARGRIEGQAPARVSPDDRAWLAECGLERLRGPGAWSVHGQAPARPYYQGREWAQGSANGAGAARRYDRTLDPLPSPEPELPPPGEVN
jgi:Flp pilus assembly secretin CpaC